MSIPDHPTRDTALVPINDVERLTGIRQGTLRAWERRYGFPQPQRDRYGERVYPLDQVERLQAVQSLLGAGVRPGRIFAGTLPPLPARPIETPSAQQLALIGMLREYRVAALHARFQNRLMDLGLRRFVTTFLAPLSQAVNATHRCGELPLRCVRLFDQLAGAFLQLPLATLCGGADGRPRAILAAMTCDTEPLDALMAESVLASLELECIPLGGGLPAHEIAAAARDTSAAIVYVHIGAAFPRKRMARALAPVRAALAPEVALWVGGPGIHGTGLPEDITVLLALDDFDAAFAAWRRALPA